MSQLPKQNEGSSSRAFASIPDRPSTLSFEARPEIKQQTFDEIYGVPENFLEIEVSIIPVLLNGINIERKIN